MVEKLCMKMGDPHVHIVADGGMEIKGASDLMMRVMESFVW
jgi:hypothetical protein